MSASAPPRTVPLLAARGLVKSFGGRRILDGLDLDVADGARTSVRMALLPADGPSGGFVHFEETLPW